MKTDRIIKYSESINEFSVDRSVKKFLMLHPNVKVEEEDVRELLESYKMECCDKLKPLSMRKDNNDVWKKRFGNLMDSYCSSSQLEVKWLPDEFDWINDMVRNYRRHPNDASLNSAIVTILRLPNWPMYSDEELAKMNKNKKAEDLGVLDWKTCPYNRNHLFSNLSEDVSNNWENIKKYVEDSFKDTKDFPKEDKKDGYMLFSKEELLLAIKSVKEMVAGKTSVPDDILPIISYYRKLRESNLKKIWRENRKKLRNDSFMETESGCQLNSYRSFVNKINEFCSVNRITNTIGNYIIGKSKFLTEDIEKQIPIRGLDMNMDVCDFSYGKGDGYKDRKVYILWTFIQCLLGPISKEWTKLQEREAYEFIGTTHQHEKLNEVGVKCTDGLGIDYTQYSDFLSRNVFREILEIVGFDKEEIDEICELISLPIMHNGKIYEVPLASNMGAKLDFILITEANLYMYLLSYLLTGKKSDHIVVVGDDRHETLLKTRFSEKEVYTKLQIAICCNCKINPEKTSWLRRDGIYGGCHVWYNRFNLPSTGIAPSQWLKDFYQISDFNSLIAKVHDSGQEEIYTESVIIDFFLDGQSRELLRRGNKYLGFQDNDLEMMIDNAMNIPWEFGGLSYHIEELDAKDYILPVTQNIINIIKANCASSFDKFVRAFHLEEHPITVELNNRKGSKNMKDMMDLLRRLRKLHDGGMISREELKSIRKDIQKFLDIQRRSENKLRSSSTKNRTTLSFDADKLFRQENKECSLSFLKFNDDIYTKQMIIDFRTSHDRKGLARLMKYNHFMDKIEGELILYDGICGELYWGLKTKEFPGRYIRMETKLDNRYSETLVTKKELLNSPNYSDYISLRNDLRQGRLFGLFKDFFKDARKEFIYDEANEWMIEAAFDYETED